MRILIIDRDGTRLEAICGAFVACMVPTYAYDGQTRSKAPDYLIDTGFPTGRWDLVLLHNNDENLFVLLELNAGRLLRYTGGTPPDEDGWIKARPIAGAADAISIAEAREILTWASDSDSGKDAILPSLLREVKAEYLPAVAVLCQGFLAVYAKDQGGRGIGVETQRALEEMGWDAGKHAHLVRESLATVTDPTWWLDALALGRFNEGGTFVVNRAMVEKARGAIAGEWGSGQIPEDFEEILTTIEAQKPVSSPVVVARAYLVIAARLAGVRKR